MLLSKVGLNTCANIGAKTKKCYLCSVLLQDKESNNIAILIGQDCGFCNSKIQCILIYFFNTFLATNKTLTPHYQYFIKK